MIDTLNKTIEKLNKEYPKKSLYQKVIEAPTIYKVASAFVIGSASAYCAIKTHISNKKEKIAEEERKKCPEKLEAQKKY